VFHQRALDLEGTDHMAGRLDDVIGTAHEPEVTVVITPRQVTAKHLR
jgi:hypothetical protein